MMFSDFISDEDILGQQKTYKSYLRIHYSSGSTAIVTKNKFTTITA